MSEEKIINRIKKMLALANDLAASEGERENALRMAYNLMTKYNIDQSQVKETIEPRIDFENQSFSWQWAKQINKVIADLFFCRLYVAQKVNNTQIKYHFVGKESNAMTAAVMADWIVKSILKEARKMYKQNTSPETRAFATGALHALADRVEKLREEEEAAVTKSSGRELVLASLYKTEADANEEFIKANVGGLVTRKSRSVSINDQQAYQGGRQFGDRINLNRQVAGETGSLKLG